MSVEILEEIKGIAKDGTDLTAISEKINGLNPLAGLKTKDEAWEFVKQTPLLSQVFDTKVTDSTKTFEDNLRAGKLADEWKEKEAAIRAELNPTESEADIKLRELNTKIETMENEKKLSVLQDQLSKRAGELNFDVLKAREYSIYGDKAIEKLENEATWIESQVEKRLAEELKTRFNGNQQPKQTKLAPVDIEQQIMEARKNGDNVTALKLQMMKNKQ